MSRNLTKFDVLARFREKILTVKSVSSSEIYKNFKFLPKLRFCHFSKNWNFLESYKSPLCAIQKKYLGNINTKCPNLERRLQRAWKFLELLGSVKFLGLGKKATSIYFTQVVNILFVN